MCNIVKTWQESKLKYQQRYASYCKQYQESGKSNKEVLGHLLECSYVLISVFGLTSKEVDELEQHNFCGLTSAELDTLM